MVSKRSVAVDTIGLCEHCDAALAMEEMPSDAIQVLLSCPRCRKILSYLSFGHIAGEGTTTKKVKWIGPDGRWVTQRPTSDFPFGPWWVRASGHGGYAGE